MPPQVHHGDWELNLWRAWEGRIWGDYGHWERAQLRLHRERRALRHNGYLWERMEKSATVYRHKHNLAAHRLTWASVQELGWWATYEAIDDCFVLSKGD